MPSAKDVIADTASNGLRVRIKYTQEEMLTKLAEGVQVDPNTGCWNWCKGMMTVGYGLVYNGEQSVAAHKASYEAYYGEIPNGTQVLVLHRCNNPKCINPDHLYLGSKKSNMYDALQSGVFTGRRILRKEDRSFIKYLHSKGLSMRLIAKMYLTNHPQISRAIKENEYAFS
jgi:hypothetical protein